MKLGLFVNTNGHLGAVTGITRAALSKGHSVTIFAMDDGTRLLADPAFSGLSQLEGVSMAFCDHSAQHLGTKPDGLPKQISAGSQYDNATMNHEMDRVIVL
jgi:predicted peroxiredoxin